jgi:hypothetical protein
MFGHYGQAVLIAIRECDLISTSAGAMSYRVDSREIRIYLCLTARNPGRAVCTD